MFTVNFHSQIMNKNYREHELSNHILTAIYYIAKGLFIMSSIYYSSPASEYQVITL